MSKPLVSDELWAVVEPLLPQEPPKPKGGRPRRRDRAVLTGILFVLQSGIPGEMLPQEMGCGSGMTCWRRLRDWQAAGVWDQLHQELLRRWQAADKLDWSRASLDSASVPAKTGASRPARIRRIAANRAASAMWWSTEAASRSRYRSLWAANVNDSTMVEATLDAIVPVRGHRGRPRQRPAKRHADQGYDYAFGRLACRQRGIIPRMARKGIESRERLGRYRWVVERPLAWLNRFRRLTVRYERRAQIHLAFLTLGCALVCWQALNR